MKKFIKFGLLLCLILTGCTKQEAHVVKEKVTSDSSFEMMFIDVGQADATLISCDGHYMLVDGGNREDSDVIYTILEKKGIDNLDIVVGTHAHEDHIGGIPGALEYATADLVLSPVLEYDSKTFGNFKMAAAKNGGLVVPKVDDTYKLGSAEVQVLAVNDGEDTNNTSIVLRIEYGNTSFMLMGDAEKEVENIIINRYTNLETDVLKLGHHGSSTSSSYHFIREVMPSVAIISCGKDNEYGHPHEEVMSRIKDANVEVYRTDTMHDIILTSDGNNITINTLKPSKPMEQAKDYIINTNSKKIHLPTCDGIDKMSDKNKQAYHGYLSELISKGYEACQKCNP